MIAVFVGVKHHYERLALAAEGHQLLNLARNEPPVVLVPIERCNRLTSKAIRFALHLSPDVMALHLSDLDGSLADEHADKLREQWTREIEQPAKEAGVPIPRLFVIHSRYRRFVEPVLHFVKRIIREHPHRQVAIVVPEVVKVHWWHFFLHNRRGSRLKSALLRWGHPHLVVITVPWRLGDHPEHSPVIAAQPMAESRPATVEKT